MLKDCPVHAHVPFRKLDQYFPSIKKHHINIELYVNALDLDETPKDKFNEWKKVFQDESIELTIHAPFMDLSPGGVDNKIRKASLERIIQLLDMTKTLDPKIIVVHPGFDHWRNDHDVDKWMKNSCEFWKEVLDHSKNSSPRIAIENVFEQSPETIQSLIESVASPRFGFCFDTGHFNLFSKKPLEDWFKRLGPYLFETHLHDNHGDEDSHSPLGEGSFPFPDYFKLLSNSSTRPILTFECHSEEGLFKSMRIFKEMME